MKNYGIQTLFLLLASCSSVESDADIINIDLVSDTGFEFVRCYSKEQPNPSKLNESYFSECSFEKLENDELHTLKKQIEGNLLNNEWSLSETIEGTQIFRKIRAYNKCGFTIHLTEELGEWSEDYFNEVTKKPIFSKPTPILIITRFTKPSCT